MASVTVIHMVNVAIDAPIELLAALWLASDVAIVWKAIRILKGPYTTDKTFDECFYRDREDIRRNGRE
jgi:hypothetical protein